MKKLLIIFSYLGLTMSSNLSIISCVNTDEQKKQIDKLQLATAAKLFNALDEKEVELLRNDLNVTKLSEKIKTEDWFTNIIRSGITLSGELTFKNGQNKLDSTIEKDKTITVMGKISSKNIEEEFTFKVKVKEKLQQDDKDQVKLDAAVEELAEINDEEIKLSKDKLSKEELKAAILKIDKYINAIKDVKVEEELTFKDETDKIIEVVPLDKSIKVTGIVQSGDKKKQFTFTIKIVDEDQQKLAVAAKLFNELGEKEVESSKKDLKVQELKKAIKDSNWYITILHNSGCI